ncbi:hypothetical protein A1O3_00061 [Capronia epimyces CBS 606.96]|uniref:Uncharacterized protein n=1 Tax=Capronia epimyces CBS 606.96 TaxID=1182542 RepID=W9YG52_9EURO|nr:uncharacterized protein A1O3_00061 [Capronia epimyces CBS 606.96]EXJ91513.1 hypothetical protein A1O3_00061 [Capronia epimyces CBS 606.96]
MSPDEIDLYDRNKTLQAELDKERAKGKISMAFLAHCIPAVDKICLSRPQKAKIGRGLRLTTSQVYTRWKNFRKELRDARRELECQPATGQTASRREELDDDGAGTESGSRFSSETAGDEDANILSAVKPKRLPNDRVTVELNGKSLTQRQLAKWYRGTDMGAETRSIFDAKNIEINRKRRRLNGN